MAALEHHALQNAVFFVRPVALHEPRLKHFVPPLQALRVVSSRHARRNRLVEQEPAVSHRSKQRPRLIALLTFQLRWPNSSTARRSASSCDSKRATVASVNHSVCLVHHRMPLGSAPVPGSTVCPTRSRPLSLHALAGRRSATHGTSLADHRQAGDLHALASYIHPMRQ